MGADSGAKKCMCKVASECKCTITQDWCSDRDLKKKARKITNEKKTKGKVEDKKIVSHCIKFFESFVRDHLSICMLTLVN